MKQQLTIPRLSGSALKVMAVLSMVIDHTAYYLMNHDTWLYEGMRCFGRIAFPVFALLVAEGFAHTKDRMKYFLSLLCCAVLSELPWYLLSGNDGSHNVMLTLSIGIIALTVFEGWKHRPWLACAAIAILAFASDWLGVDYGCRGILLIVIFFLLRKRKGDHVLHTHRLFAILLAFPLMMHYGIIGAFLASLVILMYDGHRGFIKGNFGKYAFYAIYPLHLWVIWWVILITKF
jgi:protein traX